MARLIKQVGKVKIMEAEKGDSIYSEGWTIGSVSASKRSTEGGREKDIRTKQLSSAALTKEAGDDLFRFDVSAGGRDNHQSAR